jgi:hypothetical protein
MNQNSSSLIARAGCGAHNKVRATHTLALFLVVWSAGISAQPSSPQFGFTAGGLKQQPSALDQGGEFELDRWLVQVDASQRLDAGWRAGVSLSYIEDDYGFSGVSPFAGDRPPWGTIQELRLSIPLMHRGQRWNSLLIPSLGYRGETSADLSDSRQFGMLAGSAYRFSDRLSLGPGFGVFSEIEEGVDLFPILLLDWRITDHLTLKTGRGLAASRGPGLTLQWQPDRVWRLGLGVRYEKRRFRLNEAGEVPGGVGQHRALPVSLSLGYQPDPHLAFNLLGGLAYAGELQLEDADGHFLRDSEYDTATFLGLTVKISL